MPIVPIRRPAAEPTISHREITPRARIRRPVEEPAPAKEAKPDYDVGYGKPPKHGQFKKGQSGNPKGRPKGAKGLKTIVREALTEKVAVRTAKGVKKMTKMQALIAKVTELAFAGNIRALQLLIQYYQQSVVDQVASAPAPASASPAALDEHDLAILEEMRGLIIAEMAGNA